MLFVSSSLKNPILSIFKHVLSINFIAKKNYQRRPGPYQSAVLSRADRSCSVDTSETQTPGRTCRILPSNPRTPVYKVSTRNDAMMYYNTTIHMGKKMPFLAADVT